MARAASESRRRRGRVWAIVATAALVVAGVVGWLYLRGASRSVPEGQAHALPPLETPFAFSRLGVRYRYRLRFDGTTKFTPPARGPGASGAAAVLSASVPRSLRTRWEGELRVTLVEIDGPRRHVRLQLSLRSFHLDMDGKVPKRIKALQGQIERVVRATVDASGRVRAARFDTAVGPSGRRLVRTLLGAMQFALPRRGASRWAQREEGVYGAYQAIYTVAEGAGPQVVKTRRAARGVPVTPGGRVTARFDPRRGTIATLEGSETMVQRLADRGTGRTELTLRLTVFAGQVVPPALLDAAAAEDRRAREERPGKGLHVPLTDDEMQDLAHRQELGARGPAEVFAALGALDKAFAAKKPPPAKSRAYLQLKALIYLEPAQAEALAQRMLTAAPTGPTLRLGLLALQEVGNPAAQRALRRVVTARARRPKEAFRLIATLSRVAKPEPANLRTLRVFMRPKAPANHRSMAILALGSVARRLPKRHRAHRRRIIAELARGLREAAGTPKRTLWLAALGNIGGADVRAAVWPHRLDPDSVVRAAAVNALRLVPGKAVSDHLAAALDDREERVRFAAAEALSVREGLSLAVLRKQKQYYLRETSDRVRLRLLRNLWQERDRLPVARQLAEEAAISEHHPRVREQIAAMIRRDAEQRKQQP